MRVDFETNRLEDAYTMTLDMLPHIDTYVDGHDETRQVKRVKISRCPWCLSIGRKLIEHHYNLIMMRYLLPTITYLPIISLDHSFVHVHIIFSLYYNNRRTRTRTRRNSPNIQSVPSVVYQDYFTKCVYSIIVIDHCTRYNYTLFFIFMHSKQQKDAEFDLFFLYLTVQFLHCSNGQ